MTSNATLRYLTSKVLALVYIVYLCTFTSFR